MNIYKAEPGGFQKIRAFYHSLIDAMEGCEYHPMWAKDVYPAPEELQSAINAGTLYYGVADDGNIAGAMVVNNSSNEEYAKVNWPHELDSSEYMVIHMLGVHSDYAGKGFAKELVRYAIDVARNAGMKAMRLDVLEGNVPAERLYPAMGFEYVETINMFYEDTGWTNFLLYELTL